MFLSGRHVRELIEKKGLIREYGSIEKQLTANGFDLRIGCVIEINMSGTSGDTKKECSHPIVGKIYTLKKMVDWVKSDSGVPDESYKNNIIIMRDGDVVCLERDKYYLGVTIESVEMPSNLIGVLQSRTTLFRMSGIFLGTGFVEAGYKGRLTIGLHAPLGAKIRLGSRFIQIAFGILTGYGSYNNQAFYHYQNGRIL